MLLQRLRRIVGRRVVHAVLDRGGMNHVELATLDLGDELPSEALVRLADERLGTLRICGALLEACHCLDGLDELGLVVAVLVWPPRRP